MQYIKLVKISSVIALGLLVATGCATIGGQNHDGAVGNGGVGVSPAASEDAIKAANEKNSYRIQSGDVLKISIWREPDMDMDVVVRPDGRISYPLLGVLQAKGMTIQALREEITAKVKGYIPDANVMVTVTQLRGNKIYVLGKVARSGEFAINGPVDVIQALSIAGGATPYADVGDIIVVRRLSDDKQQVFDFDYDDVKKGRNLSQNIILKSGDVVVVP